jgi:hypothetical protein
MLWNLLKGVVVLACEVAGIGVIPAALNVAGVLTTVVTIIAADDPQTELENTVRVWAVDKIADRIAVAAVTAIV